MSSRSEELDNPLYGDFEDYLDGVLPPARHQEVTDLLARSAAAREVLEELRTARKWLDGTRWEVPEPTAWPSAEEILTRAGRRPPPSPVISAVKSEPLARWSAWWPAGRMPWQWTFRLPAWASGVVVGVLLLSGGVLFWWMFIPLSPDELAQSEVSRTPEAVSPPEPALTRPNDTSHPMLSGKAPPVDVAPRRKDPAAPASTKGQSTGEQSKRLKPSADLTEMAEDSQQSEASFGPVPPTALPEPGSQRVPAVAASSDKGETKAEAMTAERPQSRPLTTAPPPGAGVAPPMDRRSSSSETADGNRNETQEASKAQVGSVGHSQGGLPATTLRLVVENRRAALAQVVAVAREFGGMVQFEGKQVVVIVPPEQVANCVARLRARVPVVTEGELLQISVRISVRKRE
ncbi:MAG: hypothetical protein ACUVR8_03870 [Acidobacteriota bacterium]